MKKSRSFTFGIFYDLNFKHQFPESCATDHINEQLNQHQKSIKMGSEVLFSQFYSFEFGFYIHLEM